MCVECVILRRATPLHISVGLASSVLLYFRSLHDVACTYLTQVGDAFLSWLAIVVRCPLRRARLCLVSLVSGTQSGYSRSHLPRRRATPQRDNADAIDSARRHAVRNLGAFRRRASAALVANGWMRTRSQMRTRAHKRLCERE